MKKLVYGSLVLVLAGMTLGSCKKDKATQPMQQAGTPVNSKTNARTGNYYSDGKMLIFRDRAAYDLIVTDPTDVDRNAFITEVGQMSYVSYSKFLANNSRVDKLMDDYLAVILNQDLIVQIGDNIYRINDANNSVFVLPAVYSSEYQDLVNEKRSNTHIKVFSTEDDVLDLLENGDQSKALFCNQSGIGSQQSSSPDASLVLGNVSTGAFHCWNRYLKLGIYYSLAIRLERDPFSIPNNSLRYYIQVENLWYHVKCGNTVGPYSFPWYSENPATKIDLKYQSYSGSKNLNGVHVKSRGRCEIPGVAQGGNPYTTIFTDWTIINVNSPY